MDCLTSLDRMAAKLDRVGRESVGLIVTKGSLHEGHASLIKAARKENKIVVVVCFKHPYEFVSEEAMGLYPSTPKEDEKLSEQAGADFLLGLSYEALYPSGTSTYVGTHHYLGDRLEGTIHPKYYESFLTTMNLLLIKIRPQRYYTGEKDFYKTYLVQNLIQDFQHQCEVKILPTVRLEQGLIIGSRNSLLSDEERKMAPVLQHILKKAKLAYQRGNTSSYKLKLLLETEMKRYYRIHIEYIEILEAKRFTSIETILEKSVVAMSIRIGQVRLADYIYLE